MKRLMRAVERLARDGEIAHPVAREEFVELHRHAERGRERELGCGLEPEFWLEFELGSVRVIERGAIARRDVVARRGSHVAEVRRARAHTSAGATE